MHKVFTDYISGWQLRLRAARLSHQTQNLVKLNREVFVPNSFDFRLRRNGWRTMKTMYKGSKFVAKFVFAKLQALASSTPELNPYQQWEMSASKVDVRCDLDIVGNELEIIGSFKLDLEAPCEIMREYIGRRFGETLNNLKVGNSFRFVVSPKDSDPIVLVIEEEPFTFSKDFTIFKIDKETMLGTMTVTIIPDPDNGMGRGEFTRVKDYGTEDDEIIAKLTGKPIGGSSNATALANIEG